MRQNTKNVSPMSNEGRNQYVVEHITDALFDLIKHKHINDISIGELCDKAGVGRASFYRNRAAGFQFCPSAVRALLRGAGDLHSVVSSGAGSPELTKH